MTKTNTKTKAITKTNTVRGHLQKAIRVTCELWHLRHWLHFWQSRTWIRDNLCYLTIKSDTRQHSQFLRCFYFLTFTFCQLHIRLSYDHPIFTSWTMQPCKKSEFRQNCVQKYKIGQYFFIKRSRFFNNVYRLVPKWNYPVIICHCLEKCQGLVMVLIWSIWGIGQSEKPRQSLSRCVGQFFELA